MNVVIVESAAKAQTINKYLGKDFNVLACYGHVRDLPAKDGSVDPDQDFSMVWEMDAKGAKRVSAIADAVKGADKVILATDPDREGEAISWHLLDILNKKRALKDKKIERVVFNAVTKDAIKEAMAHPRQIDQALVDAYLARRALDYLRRPGGRGLQEGAGDGRLRRALGRGEAGQAPPLCALHDLHAAAGGVAKARARAGDNHAHRPAAL